ncbi:hypothetical protein Dxin01_02107 [Deinococcus xinjiangensis]|uniref:Uncharacterized protein n=1 Tax=Deinococcus xinjiangensis TaxID=457454 RepID=A0ABP9VAS0_9DEIO
MTTTSNNIRTFTLGALQAAGVTVQAVDDGQAYRAVISSPDLRQILQRGALHFTFDEEYFDIHRDSDVEYVAPGYPLLDALIRMTQARFTVSEAIIPHQNTPTQLIQGGLLPLELQRSGRYRPLLRFRIRVTYKSDSYEEEIIAVTVDPQTGQTIPTTNADWPLYPVTDKVEKLVQAPSEAVVRQAWSVVEKEIQTIVADKIARQEDMANRRLHQELSKLEQYLLSQHVLNTPDGQRRIKELKDRYGLTVKLDLIFAELLHYPVEMVTGKVTRQHPRTLKSWTEVLKFEIDRYTGRIDKPPTCPVCHTPLTTLAPCDDGGHVVCPVCSTQCATCGTYHCADHPLSSCEVNGCGSGHCPECLHRCERCSHSMCADTCSVRCPDCQREVCQDCTNRCAECQHLACADHFERCHITQVPLCGRHAVKCESCGLPTHSAHLHRLTRPSGQQMALCDTCCVPCAITGELFHPDDLIQCHHTNRRISPAHIAVCPGCRHPVGHDVLVKTVDGVEACPSCVAKCWACQGTHLLNDLKRCAGDHQGQNVLLCKNHQYACVSCPPGTVYCSSHTKKCAVGGEQVCTSHTFVSSLTGRTLCAEHVHKCPDCQKAVATDELVTVTDRSGRQRQVCSACTAECLDCAPGQKVHAKIDLTTCHCQQGGPLHKTCAAHTVVCHVTRTSYASSHTVKCQSCNQVVGQDQTKMTKQGKVICLDCVGVCPHCPPGTVHALTGLRLCSTCNKVACAEHTHSCCDCGVNVCENHATRLSDGSCACSSHACSCDQCGKKIAVSRSEPCNSSAGERLCADCRITCPSCKGTHCTTHSHRCRYCGQTYCQNCCGNICAICTSLQASGSEVQRIRRHLKTIKALGVDLPDEASAPIKVSTKGARVHVLYTPPAKGFMAAFARIFSKPPQRLAVLEESREGQFKLISDREVPST